ncbi:hypothetical protein [Haloquadratum walsbyi]|nr:hypothetical protein [Haloquadratum walsbyi]
MNTDEHLEELFQEIESVSKEQIESEFNSFTQSGIDDHETKKGVIAIEELSNQFGTTERETVKSNLVNLVKYDIPPMRQGIA